MSDGPERSQLIRGLATGLAFVIVPVGIAALAPEANDPFMTPVDGRILSIAWWFMLPLGVTAAIIRSRRMWAGLIIGVAGVVAFQVSLALLLSVDERLALLSSPAEWGGALFMISVPWAIGMVFGWTSVNRRPLRQDGGSRG